MKRLYATVLALSIVVCVTAQRPADSGWVCRLNANSPAGFDFLHDTIRYGDEVVTNEDECTDPITGIKFSEMGLED